jgi:hemerythrin superfamily protein
LSGAEQSQLTRVEKANIVEETEKMATSTKAKSSSGTSKSKSGSARPKTGSRATRRANSAAAKPMDAIQLLKADHKQVKQWFAQYDKSEDDGQKQELADQICEALTVHAQIEEEIFYPAAYAALDEDGDDLVDEAAVEHATAKALIAEISAMSVGEPLFDAKVKVLGEYIAHHVQEEEDELFPECKDAGMDMKKLGEALAARKAEIMG